jgi:hypothetical protein
VAQLVLVLVLLRCVLVARPLPKLLRAERRTEGCASAEARASNVVAGWRAGRLADCLPLARQAAR